MSAVPAPLARLLALLVELGGDLHLHAGGAVRSSSGQDLPIVAHLSPGEVSTIAAALPFGDSRLSFSGDRFRVVRGPDFVVVRLLSRPALPQPEVSRQGAPITFASLLGVPSGLSPRDLPPALFGPVSEALESATRAAVACGDYAVVAELDQMSAQLRDFAAAAGYPLDGSSGI